MTSMKGVQLRGITISAETVPIPIVFFDDQFNGSAGPLSGHTPDIGTSGLSWASSQLDLSGTGYITSVADLPPGGSGYGYGVYRDPDSIINMNDSTQFEFTWSWYSGTVSTLPSYYQVYFIINTNADPYPQYGFSAFNQGGELKMNILGGPSGLSVTVADDTVYTGTLTVTNSTSRVQFLGVDQTIANSSPTAPAQIYIIASDSTRYNSITGTTIV